MMLRKHIVPKHSSEPISFSIANVATVQVTSEDADHPIDNAFDHNRDPEAVARSPMDPGHRP
jgi:hypothetical protein